MSCIGRPPRRRTRCRELRRACVVLATPLLLLEATPAYAATVLATDSETLVFTAAPARTTLLSVHVALPFIDYLVFRNSTPLSAGPGCWSVSDRDAFCPGPGGTTLRVMLGKRSDTVESLVPLRHEVDGRRGHDLIATGPLADVVLGGSGNDVVQAGDGNDFLRGGLGDDTLDGMQGSDIIDGGNGTDSQLRGWADCRGQRGSQRPGSRRRARRGRHLDQR
jgi:hypothetical protein